MLFHQWSLCCFVNCIWFWLLPDIVFQCNKPVMGFELSGWGCSRLYLFVAMSVPMSRIKCLLKMAIWWKPNSTLTATSCLCCCGYPCKNGKTAEWLGFCGNCWFLLFLSQAHIVDGGWASQKGGLFLDKRIFSKGIISHERDTNVFSRIMTFDPKSSPNRSLH